MRVIFRPDFPKDVRRFELDYAQISDGLAARFPIEGDDAVGMIKSAPFRAGHYLNLSSKIVRGLRRRNLHAFPFFLLYGADSERVIFGAVIPSRSDPLTWLTRFEEPRA